MAMTRFTRRLRALAAPLSIAALCLVAVRPWFRLEPVCSDDFAFHLLRLVQLDALLRQGVLYSRWAPDMALGYGYPFFNFYAPLSYYAPAAFSLVGLGLQAALIAAFALAPIGAGLAAYLLARDHFSPRSSLVGAVAYAYAPYLAYDALFRANLAETLAWVFLPLSLWAMGRLGRRGDRRYLAGAALAYAAVLLVHNVFALIFSPLLAAYGLVTTLTAASGVGRCRRLARAAAALLLGLGLAAFFWLPALAERVYIHSDRLLVPPVFVYWNNFVDLGELLAPPRVIHPDLLNPSPPRALGLIPILLALPALAGLYRFRGRPRRAQIAFFAVALVAYAWLTTASSRFVWDSVPLLEYIQFPWRLLGPAALCLAVLVAAAAELLPIDRRGSLVVAAAIALLIGSALFWLDPRYCPGVEAPTVASIAPFERATHTVGTTAKGEYLPRAVQIVPQDVAATALDRSSLPPGTTVDQEKVLPIGAELTITATQPFTAVYNGFDYPGWRVTVDDAVVPITPDAPYGRITFPVPEGRHRASIRCGETPLRRVADCASLACLALTIGLLLPPLRRLGLTREAGFRARRQPGETAPRAAFAWAGWGLALLGVALLLQRVETPIRHPGLQDGTLPNLDVETNVAFEGGLTLLGFNQAQTVLPSGDRFRLDLFWAAREPPPGHYKRNVALLGPNGLRWDAGSLPPRDFREPPATWAWPVGMYVQDSHHVEMPAGTPPGIYDLELTLFERETLAPMRVLGADGRPGPPSLALGQIEVTRPRRNSNPGEVEMQHRLDVKLGPLTLLGVGFDRSEAAPGDPILVTFFWFADEAPEADLTARLALLAADGSPVTTFDLPPTIASHPTSAWRAGDFWRGQHLLYLPATLEDGDYTWELTLLPIYQSTSLPTTIHITAPTRTFTPPTLSHALTATLGSLATLVGFDIGAEALHPADILTVTLAWRAEAETRTSYNVFLHLVAPDGTLAAQSDGIPAGWTRPTTGWLPGEYVTDVRTLTLPADAPPGSYTLLTGLYDTAGDRLATSEGQDAIYLIEVAVVP
jgi:hypothetical protein